MKAGRELDALIAEKVMGLIAYKVQLTAPPPRVRTIDELQRVGSPLSHYSTDIAAAWEVVQKLGRWRGFDFMLVMPDLEQTFHLHTYEAGWYEATNDGPERRVVGDADTAPLAICLAALKAVSQEGQG